jgi:hypothetical protein
MRRGDAMLSNIISCIGGIAILVVALWLLCCPEVKFISSETLLQRNKAKKFKALKP